MYVALSVCANAALLHAVELYRRVDLALEMPAIRVNLMSMARPAPKVPELVRAEAAPLTAPAPIPPVETATAAPRKIAPVVEQAPAMITEVAKPLPKPLPKPAEKIVRPQPEPKIAEPDPEPVREVAAVQEAAPAPKADLKPVVSEPVAAEAAGASDSTVIYEATYRLQVPPVYPRRALELGQQGLVLLHAEVLPNGDPRELKIAQSSGHRLLDMAALAAVRKWKFEPRNVDGNAVTSWVRVPVNFVIQ